MIEVYFSPRGALRALVLQEGVSWALGFGLVALLAILRASALGGIKSVPTLLPMSCVRHYGPLIAAIGGEAG